MASGIAKGAVSAPSSSSNSGHAACKSLGGSQGPNELGGRQTDHLIQKAMPAAWATSGAALYSLTCLAPDRDHDDS